VRIHNQPGDFIFLIGHHSLLEKGAQRKISQRHLRRRPLLRTLSGNPRQRIPGAVWASLGQKVAQIFEVIRDVADLSAQPHRLHHSNPALLIFCMPS
jgi:hypothetical protein